MDALQCDAGYAVDTPTCSCVQTGTDVESVSGTTTTTDKSADTDSTILVAVIVGGVAFLAFVAAIVHISNRKSGQNDLKHSIANGAYVPPTPFGASHAASPYPVTPQPISPYQAGNGVQAQQFFFSPQGGVTPHVAAESKM